MPVEDRTWCVCSPFYVYRCSVEMRRRWYHRWEMRGGARETGSLSGDGWVSSIGWRVIYWELLKITRNWNLDAGKNWMIIREIWDTSILLSTQYYLLFITPEYDRRIARPLRIFRNNPENFCSSYTSKSKKLSYTMLCDDRWWRRWSRGIL